MRSLAAWLAGLFMFVSFAQGTSQWKSLARTRDIDMLIDSSRVDSTRRDGMTGYWLRLDYSRPQLVAHDSSQAFTRLFAHMALNCRAGLVRTLLIQIADSSGHILGSATLDSTAAPQTFATHPLGHGAFIGVCTFLRSPGFPGIVVDTSVNAR
jgi:hypothetical protein